MLTTQPVKAPNAKAGELGPLPISTATAADQNEFAEAMQVYRKSSGRMFPTWSEVLEVLRGLGYEKVARPNGRPPGPGEGLA